MSWRQQNTFDLNQFNPCIPSLRYHVRGRFAPVKLPHAILPPVFIGSSARFCEALPVTKIKFGTDGWRAVIAQDFTFANVARVAQATADYWAGETANPNAEIFGRRLKVVVGYDRRFFSDRFAQIRPKFLPGTVTKSSSRRNPRPRLPCLMPSKISGRSAV